MSIEYFFLILRLLAGLSLLAFLLALFVIIWRQLRAAEVGSRTMATAWLRLLGSQSPGQRFALEPITTLGSSASNTIVVNDECTSGEHARIVLEDGLWWLEDRCSSQGTRLNDQAISRRVILKDDDIIGIGPYNYRLELGAGAAPETE